jgi:large subunit ribosomal protein L25
MSSTISFELDAEVRKNVGRGASRRLRVADKVPAIVYGAGEQPLSLVLDHNKTMHALSHEAFYSHILTLKVGSKKEKVILKAMQRHPAKPRILHIDFLRVRADQKLSMHIPLHFVGQEQAPGIKEGAVFSHLLSDVEVSCLPANLPEFIEVDVSNMALDTVLHLSDLKLPKGVEILALTHGTESHDISVVSLHIPKTIEEEVVAPVVEEGEAAPGVEATGDKKPEDDAKE